MKNKKNIIMIMLVALISLFGIAYAFFEYYGIGTNQEIKAGMVNLRLSEGTDTIFVTNAFPETIEQARDVNRTDNEITFTISGTNTSEYDDIYYEIMLNEGASESGKNRYNPSDLKFDLIEIDENGNETMVVDAMNFDDFNERRIWVSTIKKGTTSEITKTYKLRMWLSEDVIISDSNPNANYPASNYKNTYGSVKISVYGDMKEKSSPYNYMTRIGIMDEENGVIAYWSDEIEAVKADIIKVNFLSMKQDKINERVEAATIKTDMTDITKSEAGSVWAWLEPDTADSSKYIMYIASEGTIFFPSDSSAMFAMFTGVTEIDLNNINTRYAENMGFMFAYCTSLIDIDVSNFDTSNASILAGMFGACMSLTTLDLSSFNTDNVTSINNMAVMCSALTSLDLSGWNISNITDYSDPFMESPNLTNINLSNWELGMSNVDLKTMFSELQNLNLNLSGWDVKYALMLDNMFAEWTNLVSLDLSNWNTKYIMSMSYMFAGCTNLTTLNLNGWNTENVTNMSYMFAGCTNLTTLNLNGWNTKNVTNMSMMFAECEKLTSLDVSHFNTKNVTNMMGMFGACSSLTELDVSNFDTSSVTNMAVMFAYCYGLTVLNLSNFNTSNVSNIYGMFGECSNLMSLDISSFVINDNIKNDGELYVNIFVSMNDNCIVKVKSKDEQEWILSLGTSSVPSSWTTENVIVKG